jgi:large subunit ribosomal protein L6
VKGAKGELRRTFPEAIQWVQEDGTVKVSLLDDSGQYEAIAGTARALVMNMVTGVSKGFERKLTLVGVGYRAQVQGKALNLTLGFSHPVSFPVPEGIVIETPSQTEIVIRGIDKQKVGQVAAEIRAYRPPEPYKGKGVRYADEQVVLKEAKKK